MPLPITTVFLVGALSFAILGLLTAFTVLICASAVIEIGVFIVGGLGD